MFNLTTSTDMKQITVSSLDLLTFINEARSALGENVLRNTQLIAKIEDELEGELQLAKKMQVEKGQPMTYYTLTLQQATLVGMRESKGVRRAVLRKLEEMQAQIDLQRRMNQIPNFADPIASAHAWIAEHEDKLLAIDEHRAYKDGRGCGDSYATINEVRKAIGGKYQWRPLSDWCTANGIERREVKLTTGTQTFSYPASAWANVYGIRLSDVFADRVDAIGRGVSINYKLAIN